MHKATLDCHYYTQHNAWTPFCFYRPFVYWFASDAEVYQNEKALHSSIPAVSDHHYRLLYYQEHEEKETKRERHTHRNKVRVKKNKKTVQQSNSITHTHNIVMGNYMYKQAIITKQKKASQVGSVKRWLTTQFISSVLSICTSLGVTWLSITACMRSELPSVT